MDFSEIFEQAEELLKFENIIEIQPHEYIYLLGGCWLRIRGISGEPLTKNLVLSVRQTLINYLADEYRKRTHGFFDYKLFLNKLVFPYMTFDVNGRHCTFHEIENMVEIDNL